MRSPSAGDRPPKAIHFSIVFLSHSLTHSLTHFYLCYPFIEVVYETDGIVDASTKLRWFVHLLLRTLVESCAVIGARNGNWVFASENFVRLCPPQYWNNVVLGDGTPSNPHTTHTHTNSCWLVAHFRQVLQLFNSCRFVWHRTQCVENFIVPTT